MVSNNTKVFFGILFPLAAIGLFVTLKSNPFMFLFSIFLAIGIMFLMSRAVLSKGRPTEAGYQKAVQIQKKKGQQKPSPNKNKMKRSSRPHSLKVIEGSKGKKDKKKNSQSPLH